MLFDIGWSELLLISVVALIVVGPKDLPVLLRAIGRYVGIVRNHAQEFRNQFEQAMRESELENLKDEMTELRDDVRSSLDDARTSISSTGEKLSDTMDDAKKAADGHEFQSTATPSGSENKTATQPGEPAPADNNDVAATTPDGHNVSASTARQ